MENIPENIINRNNLLLHVKSAMVYVRMLFRYWFNKSLPWLYIIYPKIPSLKGAAVVNQFFPLSFFFFFLSMCEKRKVRPLPFYLFIFHILERWQNSDGDGSKIHRDHPGRTISNMGDLLFLSFFFLLCFISGCIRNRKNGKHPLIYFIFMPFFFQF